LLDHSIIQSLKENCHTQARNAAFSAVPQRRDVLDAGKTTSFPPGTKSAWSMEKLALVKAVGVVSIGLETVTRSAAACCN
jgi:hypothetical protein